MVGVTFSGTPMISASLPRRYRTVLGRTCRAVAVWSRRRPWSK